jgi:hypothetical protein
MLGVAPLGWHCCHIHKASQLIIQDPWCSNSANQEITLLTWIQNTLHVPTVFSSLILQHHPWSSEMSGGTVAHGHITRECWTDFHEIWYGLYAIQGYSSPVLLNFVPSVIRGRRLLKYLHLHPDDGGSKFLSNVGRCLPDCTVQHPTKFIWSCLSPWEIQILQVMWTEIQCHHHHHHHQSSVTEF